MLNYIDLPEQLSTKTTAQVTRMIANRIKKEGEAFDFNFKWDNYPFNEMKKYTGKIKRNYEIIDDCNDWLRSAVNGFSSELWDQMILSTQDSLDQWGYDALTE